MALASCASTRARSTSDLSGTLPFFWRDLRRIVPACPLLLGPRNACRIVVEGGGGGERAKERDTRLRALQPRRPHTLGHVGVCDRVALASATCTLNSGSFKQALCSPLCGEAGLDIGNEVEQVMNHSRLGNAPVWCPTGALRLVGECSSVCARCILRVFTWFYYQRLSSVRRTTLPPCS